MNGRHVGGTGGVGIGGDGQEDGEGGIDRVVVEGRDGELDGGFAGGDHNEGMALVRTVTPSGARRRKLTPCWAVPVTLRVTVRGLVWSPPLRWMVILPSPADVPARDSRAVATVAVAETVAMGRVTTLIWVRWRRRRCRRRRGRRRH